MPNITNKPTTLLDVKLKDKFLLLPLTNPDFLESVPVDFLLGGDSYPAILDTSGRSPILGEPTAVPSRWILLGKVSSPAAQTHTSFLVNVAPDLESTLKRF